MDNSVQGMVSLAKNKSGEALEQVIKTTLLHPDIFAFGELLALPNIQSVSLIFDLKFCLWRIINQICLCRLSTISRTRRARLYHCLHMEILKSTNRQKAPFCPSKTPKCTKNCNSSQFLKSVKRTVNCHMVIWDKSLEVSF